MSIRGGGACQRIREHLPAGFVNLRGEFFKAHRDEILQRVRHCEQSEKADHPLERIIDIESKDGGALITTTGTHLARRLGGCGPRPLQGRARVSLQPRRESAARPLAALAVPAVMPPWASVLFLVAALTAHAGPDPDREAFAREVDMRLEVPTEEQSRYAERLQEALGKAGIPIPVPQYALLVDRSPRVQAAFVYWGSPDARWVLIGASPVATGRPSQFEHFLTPPGVFEHTPANMDFRAEGTRNALGILGYGIKGMRVYDFGWVTGERGWGAGGHSPMRLQMHATDPGLLEPLLGQWHSKGCIRIPASLNVFIDRHGLLDAEYEAAARQGKHLWVLRADRQATPSPGRWLVVIDSGREARPTWSPSPASRRIRADLTVTREIC